MFKRKKTKAKSDTELTPENESNFEKYRKDAASWDSSRYRRQRAIAFMMWGYSCLTTIAVIALAFAIYSLAPLKTVEPYLIRVDSSTGIAETLSQTDMNNAKWTETEQTALDRYFLTKYVYAREGYSYPLRQQKFLEVSVMSSAAIAEAYQHYATRDNPESPLNLLGRDKIADIKIRSISWPKTDNGDTVAYVRFIREIKSTSSNSGERFAPQYLLATINYKYIKADITAQAREINPLGFIVSAYQITEEAQ